LVAPLSYPASTGVRPRLGGKLTALNLADTVPLNHLSTADQLVQSLEASYAKAIVTCVICLEAVREAAKIVGMPNNRSLLIDEVDPKRDF